MIKPSLYAQISQELVGAGDPSWSALCDALPELSALDSTPQSALFHAEGDVGIHTRMVLAALRADPSWIAKGPAKRAELAWACLLHDIGKPARTRTEDDGSITSRGHSGTGEVMARAILFGAGAPVASREAVCRVAKWHQIPFFAGSKFDEFGIKKLSLSMDLSELSICARADARGRRTVPASAWQETLDAIDLFDALAQDLGVFQSPLACAGIRERGLWIAKGGSIDPSYVWGEPSEAHTLVVACGLPGSGKSTLAASLGLPVVGLDWARGELGVGHGDDEGAARAMAMSALRGKLGSGSSVLFDATNLTLDQRQRLESEAFAYQAQCVFMHVEPASRSEWLARNKSRGAKSLPAKAMDAMLAKWGAPVGEEGSAQAYFKDGAIEPVWGALDQSGWDEAISCAKRLAQNPKGKPIAGAAPR